MALSGLLPTFLYPKIVYGSPATTLELAEALENFQPSRQGQRGQNFLGDGRGEYLFGRIEDAARLDLICEAAEYAALEAYWTDHGVKGSQAELWMDRFTGSLWMFEGSLKDQNNLALTLNGGGSASYVAANVGRGLNLTGAQYLSVTLAQASAATKTGFDDPLDYKEGVIVADFKPTWAGNDSVLHVIFDTSGTTQNRITLQKLVTNVLQVKVTGGGAGAGGSKGGSVSWAANTRVRIVVRWDTSGGIWAWYATASGAFTELTSETTGNSTMTALPTTLYLGADQAGANGALGVYDTVAIFKKAWSGSPPALTAFYPVWRNHFPYAELSTLGWEPPRRSQGRLIWRWPMIVRNGVKP